MNRTEVQEDPRVRRAREGNLAAFNELVLEYQTQVFNLCLRQLNQRAAAEDAAQEAFLSAWRNIKNLRGDFKPWIMRIAANACTDDIRRRGRRPSSSLDVALEAGMPEPPSADVSPEASLLQGELRTQVEAALQQLPDEQRLAVVLSDLNGLDYNEIAAAMNTSLGTVKSRIARGRARLRGILVNEREQFGGSGRQEV